MVLMISITAILKEEMEMNNTDIQSSTIEKSGFGKVGHFLRSINPFAIPEEDQSLVLHPFRVILNREISEHVTSWRFIILVAIIAFTCSASMYTALTNIGKAVKPDDPEGAFFFLKIFTLSDETLPSFFAFIGFLGPILGISMGFDAVNSEHNNRTLSRVLSQPIYRDYLINAKFLGALIVISVMFFALVFLVMGLGLFVIGIPPTAGEFMRIIFFILLSICYVAFWLNLSILFSVRFRQPATSALAGIAAWLLSSIFYKMLIDLITKPWNPTPMANDRYIILFESVKLGLLRLMPNQLFTEATTTLLMPSVRSLGPLSMEQVYGTIPGPLPLGQSLLLVWPQLTGLIAATVVCFALSYFSFMRREIRSR